MSAARWAYAAMIALSAIGATTAEGQVCRQLDERSLFLVEQVQRMALARDSIPAAVRDSLRIPAITSASSVVLVSKEVTCKAANAAYQREATGDRQTLSGRVYVVQVGSTFVVWDPDYRFSIAEPLNTFMVFNSKWVLQSVY